MTIRFLARELGLSVSAVSKALNGYPDISAETRELVRRKAEELGYTPNLMARGLARKNSGFVGMVVRDITSVYGEMFSALSEAARRDGLHPILYDTNGDPAVEKQCVQNLIDTMAAGVVVVPVSEDVRAIREMTRGRMPVVFLGGRVRREDVNYVSSDSRAGAEMALRHLTGLGHERIAMVFDHKQSGSRSMKLEAYRRAMREIGQEERIFYGAGSEPDGIAAGIAQGRRILETAGDVTAVFAVKDTLALGVLQAFAEAGVRVPEEKSVVGYDGVNAAALPLVGLTTVTQPRAQMAERVTDILRRQAEDPGAAPEHWLAQPELTVRKSTGPAANP